MNENIVELVDRILTYGGGAHIDGRVINAILTVAKRVEELEYKLELQDDYNPDE